MVDGIFISSKKRPSFLGVIKLGLWAKTAGRLKNLELDCYGFRSSFKPGE
jgi:hypothetical protein